MRTLQLMSISNFHAFQSRARTHRILNDLFMWSAKTSAVSGNMSKNRKGSINSTSITSGPLGVFTKSTLAYSVDSIAFNTASPTLNSSRKPDASLRCSPNWVRAKVTSLSLLNDRMTKLAAEVEQRNLPIHDLWNIGLNNSVTRSEVSKVTPDKV